MGCGSAFGPKFAGNLRQPEPVDHWLNRKGHKEVSWPSIDGVGDWIRGGFPIKFAICESSLAPDFQLQKSPSFRPGPFGLGLGKPRQRDCNKNNVTPGSCNGERFEGQGIEKIDAGLVQSIVPKV